MTTDRQVSAWQSFIDSLDGMVMLLNDKKQIIAVNEKAKNHFSLQKFIPFSFHFKDFFQKANDSQPDLFNNVIKSGQTHTASFFNDSNDKYQLSATLVPASVASEPLLLCSIKMDHQSNIGKSQKGFEDYLGTWKVTLNDSLQVIKANQFTYQFLGITKNTLEKEQLNFNQLLAPEFEIAFFDTIKQIRVNKEAITHRLLFQNRRGGFYGGDTLIEINELNQATQFEVTVTPIEYPQYGSREYYENLRLQNYIYIITQQIAQSGSITEGYHQLLHSVIEVLGSNFCGLLHFAADQEFSVKAALLNGIFYNDERISEKERKQIRLIARYIKKQEIINISDVSNSDLDFKEVLIENNIHAFLSFPLKHQKRRVGAFIIGFSHPYEWLENRIDFVKIIGSIILQNFLQQETREKLRRINENFVNIFDNSSDAVFIVSLNGEILEANHTAEILTGYNKLELLKKNVSEISKAENLDLAQVQYEMLQSQQMIFGTELIPRQGDNIPVETREKMIRYQGKLTILVIARDVRHRREINRMMVQTISETEDRERQRIAEGLHDNVGPLLSTLRIYIDLLKNAELTEEEIEDYSVKMNEIINQTIDTVREVSRNLMPGVLNDFGLKDAISDFCQKINKTGVIRIDFDYDVNSLAPDNHLRNVIYSLVKELINNSIKHAEASEIKVQVSEVDDGLQVMVKDNGIGVDVERQLSKNFKGLGLKNILSKINANSGKVSILDTDGFGLQIIFPLHPSKDRI